MKTKETLAKEITNMIIEDWVKQHITPQTTIEARSILAGRHEIIYTVIYQLLSDHEK